MRCPKDKNELIKENYEGAAEIDKCSACQGVWLEKDELKKIQETLKNDYADELKKMPDFVAGAYHAAMSKNEQDYLCPKCDKSLNKREYGYCSQVVIDVCPICRGIWLNKEELQRLEVFFERSKLETREVRKGFLASLMRFFG